MNGPKSPYPKFRIDHAYATGSAAASETTGSALCDPGPQLLTRQHCARARWHLTAVGRCSEGARSLVRYKGPVILRRIRATSRLHSGDRSGWDRNTERATSDWLKLKNSGALPVRQARGRLCNRL